jgi:hypothetical protein
VTALDLGDGLRLVQEAKSEDHFGHESHLKFAWALLNEADEAEEAGRVACLTIRHVAELAGNPQRYNCTMTLFWTRMLDAAKRAHPDLHTLQSLLDSNPELRDPQLHERYWSDVHSDDARARWVEPDLASMP